jgi:hypothetical protein
LPIFESTWIAADLAEHQLLGKIRSDLKSMPAEAIYIDFNQFEFCRQDFVGKICSDSD